LLGANQINCAIVEYDNQEWDLAFGNDAQFAHHHCHAGVTGQANAWLLRVGEIGSNR